MIEFAFSSKCLIRDSLLWRFAVTNAIYEIFMVVDDLFPYC